MSAARSARARSWPRPSPRPQVDGAATVPVASEAMRPFAGLCVPPDAMGDARKRPGKYQSAPQMEIERGGCMREIYLSDNIKPSKTALNDELERSYWSIMIASTF